MDGAPVRGESIPIRLFLAGYDLTPTMKDINKKFSVRYYLNLVLVDEEERRYFKQQVGKFPSDDVSMMSSMLGCLGARPVLCLAPKILDVCFICDDNNYYSAPFTKTLKCMLPLMSDTILNNLVGEFFKPSKSKLKDKIHTSAVYLQSAAVELNQVCFSFVIYFQEIVLWRKADPRAARKGTAALK